MTDPISRRLLLQLFGAAAAVAATPAPVDAVIAPPVIVPTVPDAVMRPNVLQAWVDGVWRNVGTLHTLEQDVGRFVHYFDYRTGSVSKAMLVERPKIIGTLVSKDPKDLLWSFDHRLHNVRCQSMVQGYHLEIGKASLIDQSLTVTEWGEGASKCEGRIVFGEGTLTCLGK